MTKSVIFDGILIISFIIFVSTAIAAMTWWTVAAVVELIWRHLRPRVARWRSRKRGEETE